MVTPTVFTETLHEYITCLCILCYYRIHRPHRKVWRVTECSQL